MSYPESQYFPNAHHTEDNPAGFLSAFYKRSAGHARGLFGCYPQGLKHHHTNIWKETQRFNKIMGFLPGGMTTHSHCAMAKTRSLSSRSSLCRRGGPNRKCVMEARPVLWMVGWMFFCRCGIWQNKQFTITVRVTVTKSRSNKSDLCVYVS